MNGMQKAGIGLFLSAFLLLNITLSLSHFRLDLRAAEQQFDDYQRPFVSEALRQMEEREYNNAFSFMKAYKRALKQAQAAILKNVKEELGLTPSDGAYWNKILKDDKIKSSRFAVAKASAMGLLPNNSRLFFWLSIGLAILGSLLYILPMRHLPEGIQNNGIFHSSLTARGWLGMALGAWLIAFYIGLYFFPEYLVNWVIMVDPISKALNGGPASQWFLYGFLYTLAILVMGLRMWLKYRHNRYQQIRTASVMFFQLVFAFLLPQIMTLLHLPSADLKNIWPLDYSFFFEYRINYLLSSGYFGLFLLVWGIVLAAIAVPLLTYFFGKRWYCSWVCGCGGLAETLGDPFRQLSDKSLKAWRIERWLIYSVLVFAVVMTALVLYTYFSGQSRIGFLDSYQLRHWYGVLIGSIFAGVIGTGFYPLMGNRVWCRFGCPLAAYMGIIQRFKSRYRITTNGGQCISCGNCSTYCEMGIDVRWYAQRQQDIVRASCVGCGICSAVCPRGVLKLENK